MPYAAAVAKLAQGRVVVVGDLMLDHYVFGAVDRVSPEAPVPVLRVTGERWTLGGAANVAANIIALGGTAELVGLIGEDEDGARMRGLLDGVSTHLAVSADRPTSRKTRYLSGQQQMIRIDRETTDPAPPAAQAQLLSMLEVVLGPGDVLVVSDYGKGLLTDDVLARLFGLAKTRGATTIIDPKRADLGAYRGADYITPNRKELSLAVGLPCETDEQALAAAQAAQAQTGAAVLLTRSEKGMSLFSTDADPLHLPTMARQVFDVSGAGDTVVAALALGLAAKLPIESVLRLANAAAGVVVGKHGTAVASPGEVLNELQGAHAEPTAALMTLDDAVALRARWKAQGLSVGFTNGCFDIIHPGHVSLLAQAAGACDRLIVALNTDASVSRLKGATRPIQPLDARAAVIAGLKGVAGVVAFDQDTPLAAIKALLPDVLVKGADYAEHQVVGADVVKAAGGRVLLAGLVAGQSTTAIARRAQS